MPPRRDEVWRLPVSWPGPGLSLLPGVTEEDKRGLPVDLPRSLVWAVGGGFLGTGVAELAAFDEGALAGGGGSSADALAPACFFCFDSCSFPPPP